MQLPNVISLPTVLLALIAIPACSNGQTSPEPVTSAAPAVSEATLRRGKILFLQCQACHALQKDQGHRVGPNLSGLFGRSAASAEGFGYSDALKASDIVWDREQIDAFITSPTSKVPGTIMAFAGVAKAADRSAIIDYLQTETQP